MNVNRRVLGIRFRRIWRSPARAVESDSLLHQYWATVLWGILLLNVAVRLQILSARLFDYSKWNCSVRRYSPFRLKEVEDESYLPLLSISLFK